MNPNPRSTNTAATNAGAYAAVETVNNRAEPFQPDAPGAPSLLDKWIDSYKLCQKLNIDKRTLYRWRKKGLIGYSPIGGKIYYRESDVEELLMKNFKKVK